MSHKKILVTGTNGQLGSELRELSAVYSDYKFVFTSRQELPIENRDKVLAFFESHHFDFCINCAAYTAVDKAESEKEIAFLVNATAAGTLAEASLKTGAKLIHISTDYVYDGSKKEPLKEDDPTGPLNVYGESKLEGEKQVLAKNPDSIIIRTSWVYSSYGKNFVKTMMRLLSEKEELKVVADQTGSPTYAADLADTVMLIVEMIASGKNVSGIFNYSNSGVTTWFDFTCWIKELISSKCKVLQVTTEEYPTPARRPLYSVLDTSKLRAVLGNEIPFWKDSVASCVQRLKSN
ncbi:MAG: dTDP-4-dehydrorhamnose reductase [Chitinophagaceae bacterium]|nr:dTDP-4-dehydrorhamnose reductase [Chitinophagaceae bacterium]